MSHSAKLKPVVHVGRAGSFSATAQSFNISESTPTKAVADVKQDLRFTCFTAWPTV